MRPYVRQLLCHFFGGHVYDKPSLPSLMRSCIICGHERTITMQFSTLLFAYRFNSEGMHDGKTGIHTSEQLMDYFSENLGQYADIKVTNTLDELVMEIKDRKVVWPTADDNDTLVWSSSLRRLVTSSRKEELEKKHGICCSCNQAFSSHNVFTKLGWRETQISGMCEKCWDDLFKDADEEDDNSSAGPDSQPEERPHDPV